MLATIAVVLAGYWLSNQPESDSPDHPDILAEDLNAQLDQLMVAPEAAMRGYDRDKFPHWDRATPEHGFGEKYADYRRCTTREVMLLRDGTGSITLDPKTCELHLGRNAGWRDQYGYLEKTGEIRPYKWITDSSGVDAEHIVALAEAWRSGAHKLNEDTRRRLANDALNLVASDPSANRSKGDQDAANYLPPGKFRCVYLDRYVRVKVKYALTIDPDERTALRTAVRDCTHRGEFQ